MDFKLAMLSLVAGAFWISIMARLLSLSFRIVLSRLIKAGRLCVCVGSVFFFGTRVVYQQ